MIAMVEKYIELIGAIATRYGIKEFKATTGGFTIVDLDGARWELSNGDAWLIEESTGTRFAMDVDEILGVYQNDNN